MLAEIPIREISTLAILVPLSLSFYFILTAEMEYRLFFAFLLVGLTTDLFGWYVSSHMNLLVSLVYASTYYSVLESVFFIWWITRYSFSISIRNIGRVVMVVNIIWMIFLPFNGIAEYGTVLRLTLFDAFYQIAVSFLSGFALLESEWHGRDGAIIPAASCQRLGNDLGNGVPIHFSDSADSEPSSRPRWMMVSSQCCSSGLPCWMPM